MFIAEDLHCSYWPHYEGRLRSNDSAIALFKALADVINVEHWDASRDPTDVLLNFTSAVTDRHKGAAKAVSRVEFFNSICVAHKEIIGPSLGNRVVRGQIAPVVSDVVARDGKQMLESDPELQHFIAAARGNNIASKLLRRLHNFCASRKRNNQ